MRLLFALIDRPEIQFLNKQIMFIAESDESDEQYTGKLDASTLEVTLTGKSSSRIGERLPSSQIHGKCDSDNKDKQRIEPRT